MPQTIVRGNTITVDAFYRNGLNVLVDPDDPQVSIIDAEGETVVSLDTPTQVGLGHFEYEYPVAVDALIGAWSAQWFGIIDGDGVQDEEGFTVIDAGSILPNVPNSLVTLEEFAAFLRLPLDTIDTDAASDALEGASSLVRDEVGQLLDYVADEVKVLRSTGGKCLLLPELPVVDVTLVRIRGAGEEWRELTAGVDYEVELGLEGALWRTTSALAGFFLPAGEWPRGSNRGPRGWVEVTYSHGYLVFPQTARTVTKRVAARGYVNPEAVSQESTGTRTTMFGDAPGLYLSKRDERDLARLRPGSRGGSR